MIKKFILILSAFAMVTNLSGCAHKLEPVRTEYKVVMPESKYFSGCDIVALPDPKKLTDAQVAQLINDLVKVNRICHNNNKAIHDYLERAKAELEKKVGASINGSF